MLAPTGKEPVPAQPGEAAGEASAPGQSTPDRVPLPDRAAAARHGHGASRQSGGPDGAGGGRGPGRGRSGRDAGLFGAGGSAPLSPVDWAGGGLVDGGLGTLVGRPRMGVGEEGVKAPGFGGDSDAEPGFAVGTASPSCGLAGRPPNSEFVL